MAALGDDLCTCGAGRWATWHASNCALTRETLACSYDESLHCAVHGHFAAQDDICACLHHSIDHDDDNVCSWEDCPCTDYRSRTAMQAEKDEEARERAITDLLPLVRDVADAFTESEWEAATLIYDAIRSAVACG